MDTNDNNYHFNGIFAAIILQNYGRRKDHIFNGWGKQDLPAAKTVLKNIYLSFFYGAKIGVIGLNGSGKSSLLKIIAGLDKSYQGEVVFIAGLYCGLFEPGARS